MAETREEYLERMLDILIKYWNIEFDAYEREAKECRKPSNPDRDTTEEFEYRGKALTVRRFLADLCSIKKGKEPLKETLKEMDAPA